MQKLFHSYLIVILCQATVMLAGEPGTNTEARIEELLKQMTLAEKVAQMDQYTVSELEAPQYQSTLTTLELARFSAS